MQGMISGALASAVSTLIVYPCEKIKIEMQTHSENESVVDAIRRILQKEGSLLSLYKGLKPFLTGSVLSYALYFLFYEKLKHTFQGGTILKTVKVSAVSGVLCSLLVNPFWVLQTKTALSKTDESMLEAAKKLIQSDGVASLWKGVSSSVVLVSNPIIQFCLYEWLKSHCTANKSGLKLDLIIFALACISKAVATVLTYPYTVIRTYQHIGEATKTLRSILQSLYRDGGLLRFFKGMTPKLVQTVLNSALMLVLYERLHRLFLFLLQLLKARVARGTV